MAKKKNKSKKITKGNFLGKTIKFFFVLGLWVGIALTLLLAWYAQELPRITKEADFKREMSITVKAADGTTLTRYGEVMGNSITVEDLPSHLIYAVLATEDRRFYSHFGVDLLGISRAMVVNVTKGGFVQGGSTITQQLAKNLFLTQERTLKRKIQEAMLAFWLEYELSKDEILSAYLNRVYMGAGIYGVDAATKHYFNKDVKDISVREAAMLAGLLKAPSRYSPTANPVLANRRADVVIAGMVDAGYITEDEAENLKKLPPRPSRKPTGADSVRYFTDWVVDGLEDLIGAPDEDIIVTTTLNVSAQESAQAALIKQLMADGEDKNMSQGAVVVMTLDGAVVAMVGGRDYGMSQFNRAVQAKRPPGSSFKPFVYLTALEQGWKPDDLIMDEPFTTGRYRPKNFAHEYFGEVDLLTAMALSMNTAAVRVAKEVGITSVIDTARRAGFISDLEPDLSLSLGSSGVSILELTTAYATIANGGYKVLPYAITKIENKDGEIYYNRTTQNRYTRVFGNESIENLKSMMRAVVEFGTGRGAATPFPVAGKTGTSQDSRDALFAGFSDELISVVWVGNDDNSPMKRVTGGSYPARIWRETMVRTRGMYPKTSQSRFSDGGFWAMLQGLATGSGREIDIDWNSNRSQTPVDEETAHEEQSRYND